MLGYRLSLIAAFVLLGSTANSQTMAFEIASDGEQSSSCCWIVAQGEITEQTPSDFDVFLSQVDAMPSMVRLTGTGENQDAAIELGRRFRDGGFAVVLSRSHRAPEATWSFTDDGTCEGACTLAFLGGTTREIPGEASFIPSQFLVGNLEDVISAPTLEADVAAIERINRQAATGRIVQYIVEMGIDPRFYSHSARIDPLFAASRLDRDDLLDWRIVNAGDTAGPWQAEPFGNGFFVETRTRTTNRSLLLYCVGAGETYLAFEFPFEDDIVQISNLLVSETGQVAFLTSEGPVTGVVSQFFSTEPGQWFVSFLLDPSEGDMVARSTRIALQSSDNGPVSQVFEFSLAADNPELAQRVLQVCRT